MEYWLSCLNRETLFDWLNVAMKSQYTFVVKFKHGTWMENNL